MQPTDFPDAPEEPTTRRPSRRRGNDTWSLVVITLALGVLLGFALGAFAFRSSEASTGSTIFDEDLVTSLFDRTSPAVVEISVSRSASSLRPDDTGAGFLIDADGHIVTNNHVVEGANEISVTLSDGRVLPATRMGNSPADDLAVIRVDPAEVRDIVPLTLGDSENLKPGQLAVAIGSPFRLKNSVSVGVISGVGQGPALLRRPIPNMIWTDATLNPGNSGGPLINSDGEVIGVTSAIQLGQGGQPTIGFAVPSNLIADLMPELLVRGEEVRRPWLGINGMELTTELVQAGGLSIDEGVYIRRVLPDTPAQAAGLRADPLRVPDGRGDVIVAVDRRPVRAVSDIVDYFNGLKPGDEVILTIFRAHHALDVAVTLAGYVPPGS